MVLFTEFIAWHLGAQSSLIMAVYDKLKTESKIHLNKNRRWVSFVTCWSPYNSNTSNRQVPPPKTRLILVYITQTSIFSLLQKCKSNFKDECWLPRPSSILERKNVCTLLGIITSCCPLQIEPDSSFPSTTVPMSFTREKHTQLSKIRAAASHGRAGLFTCYARSSQTGVRERSLRNWGKGCCDRG